MAAIHTTATTPIPVARQTWICSGQSNAAALCGGIDAATGMVGWAPALSSYANVDGNWLGGQSIVAWNDVNGSLWDITPGTPTTIGLREILAAHRDASAFVWWQGEADYGPGLGPDGAYLAKLRDLIARVRLAVNNPTLRVVIVELGPAYQTWHIIAEQREFVAGDGHALYIATDDLSYKDGIHMTPQGYEAVAARIAAALR